MEIQRVQALSKDLRIGSQDLREAEVRFLVDTYYMMQEKRMRAASQVRILAAAGEPNGVVTHILEESAVLEKMVKISLDVYTHNHPIGNWLHSVKGIGPVLSAGLLAHIDITKAPTVGHIWSFAGLEPTAVWNKGEKRPWNARLKTLCWKIGESFVKVSGGESPGYYGTVYKNRKEYEIANNEAGRYADQAAAMLKKFNYRADTEAKKHYEAGRLPPLHIHRRACRYAVKLFLSHLHHVWYVHQFGTEPPKPYPIAHMQHVDHILPPATSV
jgi:hypothetical protein